MNVQFYYKRIDPLPEDVQEFIVQKMETLAEHATVQDVHVEVSQKGETVFHVAVEVKSDHGAYHADETASTVEQCIESLEQKLTQQMRRSKEKSRDLTMRGARTIKKGRTLDDDARL